MEALLLLGRRSSNNRRLHRSWVNEIDGRFFGTRHGFQSGSVENMNDGCVVGFGISSGAIAIAAAAQDQFTYDAQLTVRNRLGGISEV